MKARFGVQIPQEGLTYDEIKHIFRKLDRLDFYSVLIYDHLHPIWSSENVTILENWVLLSALSKETRRIRIGTLVNCNGYRYAPVLAKMAASLDVISNGRLEFMIGAGWYEATFKGYGIPFLAPRKRIGQLKEAIQIIKLMWTEHKTYFKGKYYQLNGALCYPKPFQKPYPRIWVGGGGEKYTLKVVAEVGEGSNFFGSVKDFERKLNLLRKYCQDVGRDYASIPKSWTGDTVIGKNEKEVKEEVKELEAKLKRFGRTLSQRPALIGTPQQVIDQLKDFVKLGVNYFIIVPTDPRDLNAMELFSEEVIPSFN